MLKAVVVLGFLLFVGQRIMRPWFQWVAGHKSPELFTLNLLLFTLGLAFLTETAGLSLALGAFLAGMLISETEYRYQVEDDIKPFRDVLLGLFFVTIGMRLDLHAGHAELGRCAAAGGGYRDRQGRAGGRAGDGLRQHPAHCGAHRAWAWRRPANSASCCWRWRRI